MNNALNNASAREPRVSAPSPRPATPADRPAVERLLTVSDLPIIGIAEILETRAHDFVVAEDPSHSGELAAVAGLEVCCDNALLRSVAVRPEWRTRGLGRELILRLIADAESRGLNALYLLTTTAEHYFPRFGFAPVDRRDVPQEIRETEEFRGACPASAVAMRLAVASSAGTTANAR